MTVKAYDIYDDRKLVELVVEGDISAFDALFARHSEMIYATLQKFTGHSDDVDDLMQEAFMKAFLKIGLYNPKYDFGAWIYTIARNTFVDFSRSRKSNAINPQNISLDNGNISQASAPTPEDYRQLFELRFLDEYSYEEIAEKLDMKLGTVKTRIFRVRNMMCQFITKGEEQSKKLDING